MPSHQAVGPPDGHPVGCAAVTVPCERVSRFRPIRQSADVPLTCSSGASTDILVWISAERNIAPLRGGSDCHCPDCMAQLGCGHLGSRPSPLTAHAVTISVTPPAVARPHSKRGQRPKLRPVTGQPPPGDREQSSSVGGRSTASRARHSPQEGNRMPSVRPECRSVVRHGHAIRRASQTARGLSGAACSACIACAASCSTAVMIEGCQTFCMTMLTIWGIPDTAALLAVADLWAKAPPELCTSPGVICCTVKLCPRCAALVPMQVAVFSGSGPVPGYCEQDAECFKGCRHGLLICTEASP